jgi:DNA polymerase
LHLDYETRSVAELGPRGAYIYANHPTTDIWMACYAFGDEDVRTWYPYEPCPEDVREHIESGGAVWGHNVAFELLITRFITAPRYGWPVIKAEQSRCTMVNAYSMGLPGSLENAATVVGLAEVKDMAGNKLMRQMSRPKSIRDNGMPVWEDSAEKIGRLAQYCRQDVRTERELSKRLVRISAAEHRLWVLDQKINDRGFAVDIEAATCAREIVRAEALRLDDAMRELTENAVASCKAVGQLKTWIQKRGVKCESLTKADVVELLAGELSPVVRQALTYRQEAAKTSTAKLDAMVNRRSEDGRIRHTLQFYGAPATGRWAGRGIQIHNFPRPKMAQADIEFVLERMGQC